ncbi:hypothetical protein [Paenibacillus polymyxa]|uniref:hypothetical protein n=1 Tax=Paenibacillus polymyxa TaxID=1406 RepID=UPI001E465082|nr:hypothetical protein [Paenibacillus polymyxa]
MKINLLNGLPIVSLTLRHHDQTALLPNVLFDTGCAATVFDTDLLAQIGIHIDFITGEQSGCTGWAAQVKFATNR